MLRRNVMKHIERLILATCDMTMTAERAYHLGSSSWTCEYEDDLIQR